METNTNKNIVINQLTIALELYWLNQLKKKELINDEEYFKMKSEILNKR